MMMVSVGVGNCSSYEDMDRSLEQYQDERSGILSCHAVN